MEAMMANQQQSALTPIERSVLRIVSKHPGNTKGATPDD